MRRNVMPDELRYTFANHESQAVQLHLEPWGELFTVYPGAAIELVATRLTPDAHFETETQTNLVIVTAPGAAVVRAFHRGAEIGYGYSAYP